MTLWPPFSSSFPPDLSPSPDLEFQKLCAIHPHDEVRGMELYTDLHEGRVDTWQRRNAECFRWACLEFLLPPAHLVPPLAHTVCEW